MKELFQDLQKLRRSVENITITQDLTKKQREELQGLISETSRKKNVTRQVDLAISTKFVAHHGDGLLRKLQRRQQPSKYKETITENLA